MIIYNVMAKLPRYGWFHNCEQCEKITSRLTNVKYKRKTRKASVCIECRHDFIIHILNEFNIVIIHKETISEQQLLVYYK